MNSENFANNYNTDSDTRKPDQEILDNTNPGDQIENIASIGEQYDNTPVETYQERGAKVEAATNGQAAVENTDIIETKSEVSVEPSAEEHQQAVLDDILQAPESINSESQLSAAENRNNFNDKIREIIDKAKNSQVFKLAVAGVLVASIGIALTACSSNKIAGNNQESTTAYEQTTIAGEQENGLKYDYTAYNSPEKLNKNNFGEDLRKYHGDRDAMVEAMMKDSNNNPEMLVSEAYNILTPSQKREIGIENMNMDEIDETLNGENGEELRQRMFNSLNNVMNNEETDIEFITSNGRAWTLTEYTVDKNKDGKQTPDETYIGTAKTYRHNVKQFVVTNESNGEKTVTVINEYCGLQADTKDKPEGLEEVDPDEPVTPPETTTEPTTEATTQWGKSGDPHGGPDVTKSDQVDPNSEVSKERNDDTNKGNQGNANTKPGSSSGSNNNGDRKPGGESQDSSGTNGSNSAPKGDDSREASGNEAQRQAQEQNQPGGDNNSNAGEEARVADGDF